MTSSPSPSARSEPDTSPAGGSLRVALVQRASGLEPEANRAALDVFDQVPEQVDLVVYPEVFARDFGKPGSPIGEYAEELDGPFGQALGSLAAKHDTAAIAGMFERSGDPERPYNTLLFLDPRGEGEQEPQRRESYRKIHLYDSFGYRESDRLSPGPVDPVVFDVGGSAGFRVGLMTCYDLRFPELARALVERGAEVLVVPAAWVAGEDKVDHWRTLVRARAIENTAYVVAAAQPAPRYCGHSMVVAPDGAVSVEAGGDESRVLSGTLERAVLERAREQNPSLANRRM